MVADLEARVTSFFRSLTGAEDIDEVLGAGTHEGSQRADFLLEERRIIVELKTLKTDTSDKVGAIVQKHREREDFPLFYTSLELDRVLSHLPDGQQINRRIFGAISRSVEGAVRSAERQIHDTRRILELESSASLLVLVNESVDILSPEVVGCKVASLMRRERTGRSDAAVVNFAWLLFESHVMALTRSLDAFPSLLIAGRGSEEFPWFEASFTSLQEGWAGQNDAALAVTSARPLHVLGFKSRQQVKSSPPRQITRQQLWEREYDAAPFLRSLSDQQVLEHGATAIQQIAPYFLKGGPEASPEEMERLGRLVTCFFREASFRALDLRKLPKLVGNWSRPA